MKSVSMLDSIIITDNIDIHLHYNEFSNTKKMVYLIQQTLLCDYITMFSGAIVQDNIVNNRFKISAPFLLRSYRRSLEEKSAVIPKDSFNTGKYLRISKVLMELLSGNMPEADDIIDIFYSSEFIDDIDIHLPKEFLLPYIYSINGTYIEKDRLPMNANVLEEYGEKANGYEFSNPIVYIPSFIVDKKYGFVLKLETSPTYAFSSFVMYDYESMRKDMHLPYRYLACMNWRGKNFLHIVGFLENFSIEHDPNLMMENNVCSIGDICYDIVTNCDYCRDCKPFNIHQFISAIKYICERWKITITDCEYLGEILRKSKVYDSNVINYLTKKIEDVTVAETQAFERSAFFSIVKKSSTIALEANDTASTEDEQNKDDNDDEITDDIENIDTEDNELDEDISNELDDESDEITSDSDDNEKDDETDKEKTENVSTKEERIISPSVNGILLELLNPENETLSDFLYRKEFLIRTNELLKNTSQTKVDSQILFMLKEWATKWLYIFSVPSLKSFLRNLNVSLMPKQ